MRVIFFALLILGTTVPVFAIDAGKAFDDPALQARYETIIAEVRCVMCQNQSIKDSNALIATDLRREIRRQIGEGSTDAEIYDFLVQRYGDFVLYRPPLTGKTFFLWAAPGLFILFGIFIVLRVVRDRMSRPIDDGDDNDPDPVAS